MGQQTSEREGVDAEGIRAERLQQEGQQMLGLSKGEAALRCFEEAIALRPEWAEAHNGAGIALKMLRRAEEAAASFERAVELRHDYVDALNNLAGTCLELGRHEDAEDCCNLVLTFQPDSALAYFNLGMFCSAKGKLDEAIGKFRRVVELAPDSAGACVNLGTLYAMREQPQAALEWYMKAEALTPDVAELHLNCGLMLQKLGRIDEAAERFSRALTLKSDFPEAHFSLGDAYSEGNEFQQAIDSYRTALSLRPDYAEAHNNLGNALKAQGRIGEAIDSYRQALTSRPDYAEAYSNLGLAFFHQMRWREALEAYENALVLRPEFPEASLNLALVQLAMGDFERGWAGYEWRFRQSAPNNLAVVRNFPYPSWQGEDLSGRSLLIWGEQGIGDEILFASLIPELAESAGRCIVECAPKLVALFRESFPRVQVVARSDPPDAGIPSTVDYQVALGSAARWLRPGLASFPKEAAYLRAVPARVDYWRRRLAGLGEGIKVGFCWRSRNVKGERALAYTRIDQWGAIFGVRGVHFVCLQYDECGVELEEARRRFDVVLHAFPEVDLFDDLAEAAALTAACDLVISAPTSVAILAAALGVPTWRMTYGLDWMTHGTDYVPWFPSMRRFNRVPGQTWEEIMDDVAEALAARAGAVAIDV